jgi:hypothetical protein
MRPREERRNVLINSRLRSGATWRAANIMNISSRGVGLRAPAPPEVGTYVEITCGPHLIVARIMWVDGQRFGAFAQDTIPVESVISDSLRPGSGSNQQPGAELKLESRPIARCLERRHQASKAAGSAMEFIFLAILAGSAALLALDMVEATVGRPMAEVTGALSR